MNIKPGIYEHFKGKHYRVLGVAVNRETEGELVIYEPLHEEDKLWARPTKNFLEEVIVDGKKIPRFKFVKDK